MVIRASGGLLRELAQAAVDNHRDSRAGQDAMSVFRVEQKQREVREIDAANDSDALARKAGIVMTVAKAAQTTASETRKAGEAASDIQAKPTFEANVGSAAAEVKSNNTKVGAGEGAPGSSDQMAQLMNTRLGGDDANRVGDVFSQDQMKTLLSGKPLTKESLGATQPPFTEAQTKDILELQGQNGSGVLEPKQVADFVWANRGRSESQAQGDQQLKISNAFITTMSAGADGMLKLGGEERRRHAKAAGEQSQIGAQMAQTLGQAAASDNQLRNDIAMHVVSRSKSSQA